MSSLTLSLPRSSRLSCALLVLVTCGVAPGAAPRVGDPVIPPSRARPPSTRPAEAPKDPAAQMARWFADLGHPDPSVREAARVSLMGVPRKDLHNLERLVRDAVPLVPAQAVVLREIVTHIFLTGEKYESTNGEGFLGVRPSEANLNFREPPVGDLDANRFGAAEGDPAAVYGVVITERMPGFCGARALHDGDVILSMVEHPDVQFRVPQQFSLVVRSVGAGRTVHFQILRQGQIVRVPVTLDPRPDATDVPAVMTGLLNERKAAAEAYWDTVFAPLLKEGVG